MLDHLKNLAFVLVASATTTACFPDLPASNADAMDVTTPSDIASHDIAEPGEAAVSGECESADDCTHLAANCLKVLCLASTCATQPDPGASCNDGDPCTQNDSCSGTVCSGTAYTCDDGIVCTANVCDGQGGCDYPVADGFCRIDGACVERDATRAGDPCRICRGGEAWSPNDGANCEDGDTVCTVDDICEGTTCVGGDRPSDADTDWVFRPVEVATPGTAAVVGVVSLGDDVVFVSESTGGGSATVAGGSEIYAGASVQVFRRGPSGLAEYLSISGFEYARVVGTTIRDTGNGRLGFAYRYRGQGELRRVGVSPVPLAGDGYEAVLIQMFPFQLLARVPFSNIVASSNSAIGMVVLSEFNNTFVSPAPEVTLDEMNVGDAPELAITSLSGSGGTRWVAHVGAQGRLQHVSTCMGTRGTVHVALSHVGSAVIADGVGGQTTLGDGDSGVRSSLITFADDGGLVEARTIASFAAIDSEAASWAGAGLFLLSCDDAGAIAAVNGVMSATSLPIAVGNGDSGDFNLLRLVPGEGTPAWSVALTDLTPMAVSKDQDGTRWIAVLRGPNGQWSVEGAPPQLLGHDNGNASLLGLLRVVDETRVAYSHTLVSSGVALSAGVAQLTDGTVVVGGTTIFAEPTFVGADREFSLTQPADVAGFLLGVNSSRGLQCLAE